MTKVNKNRNIYILNVLSFYSLLFLPLAYIFSATFINIIVTIIAINLLISSFTLNEYSLFKTNFFKIILIFTIYIFIQSIFLENTNPFKSISYMRFFLLPLGIVYLLNNNLSKINFLKYFYLLSVFFVIIDIAIQYFTGKDLFGYRADVINGFIGHPIETWNDRVLQRFAGPFGFDKKAGTFILFFSVVGYFLNNNLNKNKNFYYLTFLFSIIFVSIIITGDRAPLIILFIFFVLIIIFENSIRKKAILFFAILLLIFSLMFFFSKNTKYRFLTNIIEYSSTQKSDNNSISKIKKIIIDNPWTAHYLTAFEIFKDSPIFGKGIRSFRYECEKYPDIKSSYASSRCSTHPHNLFLEILSEVGIVGLIFFILIFYEFMRIKKISYSNNIIFYLLIALILPIKPTGALFSTWFGSLLLLLIGFYYWEINKKKINR